MATFKLKTYALPTLSEAQLIDAVEKRSNKGCFRTITWITDEFNIGSDVITITKTRKNVKIGINYNHMKSVIDRKAAEDAAIGAPKDRRESSYDRLCDTDGKFVEPVYIVRDRKTMTKKFLQVCLFKNKKSRTIEKFYRNGVEVEPTPEIAAARRVTPHYHSTDTIVLSLNKIINIK